MFKSVGARFALRATLAGVLAGAVSLQEQLPFDATDIAEAGLKGVIAGLLYAGLGAALPQVEPNVGNKQESE